MVVPAAAAEKVYEIAHGREVVEEIIKAELIANPGPPGKYYPFKPPIKPESPLGKLLTSKGVKFYSTRAGPSGAGALRPVRTGAGAGRFGAGRRHMSTVPATMKAAVVRETGPADVLKVETDFPVPSIADGQVRAALTLLPPLLLPPPLPSACCHPRLRPASSTAAAAAAAAAAATQQPAACSPQLPRSRSPRAIHSHRTPARARTPTGAPAGRVPGRSSSKTNSLASISLTRAPAYVDTVAGLGGPSESLGPARTRRRQQQHSMTRPPRRGGWAGGRGGGSMAGRVHATATLSRLDGSWSPEPETQIKPIPIPIPPQPLHATEATSARKRAPPQPQPSRPRLLASRCAFATRTSRYHRGGLYARDLPFIAGQEGGGTIAASTPKAEAAGFGVGKRVAYSVLGTRRMVQEVVAYLARPQLATNRPCLRKVAGRSWPRAGGRASGATPRHTKLTDWRCVRPYSPIQALPV